MCYVFHQYDDDADGQCHKKCRHHNDLAVTVNDATPCVHPIHCGGKDLYHHFDLFWQGVLAIGTWVSSVKIKFLFCEV